MALSEIAAYFRKHKMKDTGKTKEQLITELAELVEAYGGTIEVQSELGKGSTFTVRLPSDGQEEEQHAGESQHPDSG